MIAAIGGINLYKTTKHNLAGSLRKLRIFNGLTRFIFRIIGYERYMLLIRLLRPFSRYEAQIHLLYKKYDSTNIY